MNDEWITAAALILTLVGWGVVGIILNQNKGKEIPYDARRILRRVG